MASAQQFRFLMSSFARSIGLGDVSPGPDGVCALAFDDIVVRLEHDSARGDVAVTSTLAPVGDLDATRARRLLELSHAGARLGAGQIGIDGTAGTIEFSDRIAIDGMEATGLQAALEIVVHRVESWKGIVSAVPTTTRSAALAGEAPIIRA